MSLLRFWRPALLLSRPFLWLMFWINLGGTIYGYMWYGNQLIWTVQEKPLWLLVFVPDSPTASLFFTLALLYLLFPPVRPSRVGEIVRAILEALAVVTSIKYGIWAVVMIFAGAAQGNALGWQDWMLVISHLGMAVEVVLYMRFMRYGKVAAVVALGWVLLNDTLDYNLGIYPWLPRVLEDDLRVIEQTAYGLSILSFLAAWLGVRWRRAFKYTSARI